LIPIFLVQGAADNSAERSNLSRFDGRDLPALSREPMLWTIFAILIILWLLGWGFHVAGSMIHLLLVIAIIVAVINLISGRRTV
jgi:DMSO reductase anchor subunit